MRGTQPACGAEDPARRLATYYVVLSSGVSVLRPADHLDQDPLAVGVHFGVAFGAANAVLRLFVCAFGHRLFGGHACCLRGLHGLQHEVRYVSPFTHGLTIPHQAAGGEGGCSSSWGTKGSMNFLFPNLNSPRAAKNAPMP